MNEEERICNHHGHYLPNSACCVHNHSKCHRDCDRPKEYTCTCLIDMNNQPQNSDDPDSYEIITQDDINNNYLNRQAPNNFNTNHYAPMPPKPPNPNSHECNQTNSRAVQQRIPLGTPRTHYPPNPSDARSSSHSCDRIPPRSSRSSSLDRPYMSGSGRGDGGARHPASRSRQSLEPQQNYNNGDVWSHRLESLQRERTDCIPKKYSQKDYDPYHATYAMPPQVPSVSRRDSTPGRYSNPPTSNYQPEPYWGDYASSGYYTKDYITPQSSNSFDRPHMGAEGDYRQPEVDGRYYDSYGTAQNDMQDYCSRRRTGEVYSRRNQYYDSRNSMERAGYQSDPVHDYSVPRRAPYIPSGESAAYSGSYHSEDDYGQFSTHRRIPSTRSSMREMRRDIGPPSMAHTNQSSSGVYVHNNYPNQYASNPLPHGHSSITRTSTSRPDPRRSTPYLPMQKDQRLASMR